MESVSMPTSLSMPTVLRVQKDNLFQVWREKTRSSVSSLKEGVIKLLFCNWLPANIVPFFHVTIKSFQATTAVTGILTLGPGAPGKPGGPADPMGP